MTRERGGLYPEAGIDRLAKTKQHTSKWPIHSEEFFTTDVLQQYRDENAEELMMTLGEWKHVVPEQQRGKDDVSFSNEALYEADKELHDAWVLQNPEEGIMTHSHIVENGHGIGPDGKVFSVADEVAMQQLHDSCGKDTFGLVINGEEVDGDVAYQHAILADHTGDLLEQAWDAGKWGKVMTTFLDADGVLQRVYSDSIQEAEEKSARVVQMKELESVDQDDEMVQMQIAWLKEELLREAA